MANDNQMSGTSTSSPRAPGSEADKGPSRPNTKEEIDRMPGAGSTSDDEAEGEGDGKLDEEEKDGAGI